MNFRNERAIKAGKNWNDLEIRAASLKWHNISRSVDYQYMFEFAGLPIIQDPQDIVMLQEVIWRFKPTIIIETGIARGGSLVLSASILATLSYAEQLNGTEPLTRKVIGVDIDIREHNRNAIECHPLSKMVKLIQGSSISPDTISKVKLEIKENDKVLVILDSNHTEEHVLEELKEYSNFVTSGSAILVMDTGIEFSPPTSFNVERPWRPGSNPYTATKIFLNTDSGSNFSIDRSIEFRHLITCAPEGLLVKN
jgi:cephalosporin hydroxylase